MKPRLLVVARHGSALYKFQAHSILEAVNTKDFLEETGEYEEVSIFQQSVSEGPVSEWVKLAELEC